MKKVLFVCVCSVALFSTTAEALRFGTTPIVQIEMQTLTHFLPSHNDALDKALEVHNLMTELPTLQTMAEQQEKLKEQTKKMKKFFENLLKCNEKRFGRFKNSKDMLKKVRAAYEERTKDLKDEEGYYPEDSIMPRSLAERDYLWDKKKDIEQEIMTDALTNGRKWGGELVNRRQQDDVPEDMRLKMTGTGLEELMMAEDGTKNADVAEMDMDKTFKQMQESFIQRAAKVGFTLQDFDASRTADINKARKGLKELKDQYIVEAKEYVVKLDEQDAAHPRAVEKRAARTRNKAQVLANVKEQFPEAFAEMERFDQQTPQQQQMVVIAALEKDANGTVYLTETNATEIDQRIGEAKANKALLQRFTDQAQKTMDEMQSKMPQQDFDFSVCS